MVKADERVMNYFDKIQKQGIFDEAEFKIITEGYTLIKPFIGEDMYSELSSELVTAVLDKRGTEEATYCSILEEVAKNIGLTEEPKPALVRLRELNASDASYDKTESTRRNAVSKVYEELKSSNSLKNQVFLDVLSGMDRNTIARRYRLTRSKVDSIYEERLAFVKNVLVVNDDILVEEVESNGPIQSNVKMLFKKENETNE